jgi:hypothetical protein
MKSSVSGFLINLKQTTHFSNTSHIQLRVPHLKARARESPTATRKIVLNGWQERFIKIGSEPAGNPGALAEDAGSELGDIPHDHRPQHLGYWYG